MLGTNIYQEGWIMKPDKKRIVIKVGTSTITHEDGSINFRVIDRLCRVLSEIESRGYKTVLVSSGAIGVGVNKLRLKERPEETRMKQAAAAVGQCGLMHIYDKFFGEYGKVVAQILFTGDDLEVQEKRENLSNTLEALMENGVIPIINENDSLSYNEIISKKKIFGDNDMLSAIVANFTNSGKLIILSDIEGLYDSNPKDNPEARLISRVESIDEKVLSLAGGAGSARGTGGMISKLDAADYAMKKGIDTLIILGKEPERIYDIIDGKKVGTLFVGREGWNSEG